MCKGNIVKADTHTQFHDYIPNKNTTTIPSNNTTTNSSNPNKTLTTSKRRLWWLPEPQPLKKLGARPLVEKFEIKFRVKIEMVPSCRVMVYYVRKDKEVVADSVELDVEDKLENQVKAYTRTNFKNFQHFANRPPRNYAPLVPVCQQIWNKWIQLVSSDLLKNLPMSRIKSWHTILKQPWVEIEYMQKFKPGTSAKIINNRFSDRIRWFSRNCWMSVCVWFPLEIRTHLSFRIIQ